MREMKQRKPTHEIPWLQLERGGPLDRKNHHWGPQEFIPTILTGDYSVGFTSCLLQPFVASCKGKVANRNGFETETGSGRCREEAGAWRVSHGPDSILGAFTEKEAEGEGSFQV